MKPIQLKVKGLNSFIEEQTVDFTKLTSRGLFGIFGSTGSGKSTILDGITLALYGQIVRKSTNLINMNCDDLAVQYTFQISGVPSRVYRVTRNFKRDKKTEKVKSQRAVLEEITNNQVEIVADKTTKVTSACEKIIGLSIEDFTRTVVLPQGRFSEFLKLEGKDRREMLERLFHLQEYGDKLCEKLRSKITKEKTSLNQINGEIKGYQGISQEALNKEKANLKALNAQLTTLKEKHTQLEDNYKKGERVWKLQNELEHYQKEQTKLLSQERAIKEKESTLQLGASVEKIQSSLKAYDTTQQAVEKDKKNVSNFTAEKDKLMYQKQAIEAKYVEICSEREEKLVPLSRAKEQIDDAVTLQQELRDKEIANKEIEEKLKLTQNKIQKIEIEKEKNQQTLNQALETLAMKQNQEKNLKVESTVRSAVNNAMQYHKEIQFYQNQKNNLNKKLEKELQKQKNRPQPQIDPHFMPVILQLRQTLKEDEPCPVCGSLHHNATNQIIEQTNADIEDVNQRIIPLEKQIQAIQNQLNTTDIKAFNKQLNENEKKAEALNKEITQLTNQVELLRSQDQSLTKKQNEWTINQQVGFRNQETCQKEKQTILQKLEQKITLIYKILPNNLKSSFEAQQISNVKKIIEDELRTIEKDYQTLSKQKEQIQQKFEQVTSDLKTASASLEANRERLNLEESQLLMQLQEENLALEEVRQFSLTKEQLIRLKKEVESYNEQKTKLQGSIDAVKKQLNDDHINEETWYRLKQDYETSKKELKNKEDAQTESKLLIKQIEEKIDQLEKLQQQQKALEHELAIWTDLEKLFKGKKFVEFVATQRLQYISLEASKRLKEMSGGIYSLETDENGKFMICDYKNGGAKRDASTLSGGETFLVSLALALSLSAEIQLKGTAPLELFFLDEGFGTLDEDLLDVVMNSLEKLHHDKLKVGIISHIDSIKERVPVKLVLTPAIAGEGGTKVKIEL